MSDEPLEPAYPGALGNLSPCLMCFVLFMLISVRAWRSTQVNSIFNTMTTGRAADFGFYCWGSELQETSLLDLFNIPSSAHISTSQAKPLKLACQDPIFVGPKDIICAIIMHLTFQTSTILCGIVAGLIIEKLRGIRGIDFFYFLE